MKRSSALIVSVIMALSLASCAGGDSSSQAEDVSSTVSESTPAESTEDSSVTESEEDLSSLPQREKVEIKYLNEVGEYAKTFSNRLLNDAYSVDVTVTTSAGAASRSHLSIDGYRAYVKMQVSGLTMEIYFIDGKTYSLVPSIKSIIKPKTEPDFDSIRLDIYALDSRAELKSSEEKDGQIVEVYGVPAAAHTPEGYKLNDKLDLTVTYYFDKQTGNATKLTVNSPLTGMKTVTFERLEFGSQRITLPDIKGWTEIREGEEIDGSGKLRMTMAALGITEEMLIDSGYTFDQIAAMSSDEMSEALAKVMKKNNIS